MMLTACLLATSLAQPLDTSKVKTTRVETTVDVEPSVTPPDGADTTFDGGADDRGLLQGRFGALAEKEGLPGLGGVAPESGRMGVVAARPGPMAREPEPMVRQTVWRTVKDQTTTWTFTAARLESTREGTGCCPPCPCSPDGNCAPCVACLEETDCRTVTHGVHLTVTFAVAGRKLVKEEVRVQRVSMSFQRGGGARGLKLERVEPTDAPFAKALQRQRARLEAGGKRADGASGRLGFDVRFEADGRVSKVVRDDACPGGGAQVPRDSASSGARASGRCRPGTRPLRAPVNGRTRR
jgi:hypothetical protein